MSGIPTREAVLGAPCCAVAFAVAFALACEPLPVGERVPPSPCRDGHEGCDCGPVWGECGKDLTCNANTLVCIRDDCERGSQDCFCAAMTPECDAGLVCFQDFCADIDIGGSSDGASESGSSTH